METFWSGFCPSSVSFGTQAMVSLVGQRGHLWPLSPAIYKMPAYVPLPGCLMQDVPSLHRLFPLLSLWHHQAIQVPRWDSWELSWLLLLSISPVTESGQFHLQSHPQKCLLSTVHVFYHLDHDFRHLIIPLTSINLLVTYCSHLLYCLKVNWRKGSKEKRKECWGVFV